MRRLVLLSAAFVLALLIVHAPAPRAFCGDQAAEFSFGCATDLAPVDLVEQDVERAIVRHIAESAARAGASQSEPAGESSAEGRAA